MAQIVNFDEAVLSLERLYRDATGEKGITWEQSWADRRGTTYLAEIGAVTYVLIDERELYVAHERADRVRQMKRGVIRRLFPGIKGRRWFGGTGKRHAFAKIAVVNEHARAQIAERFTDNIAQLLRGLPTPQFSPAPFTVPDNLVELTGRKQEAVPRAGTRKRS